MNEATAVMGRFVIPAVVATNFHLREGDIVADLGAGSGYFVPTLSQLVGQTGKVYAVEVQKNLVEKISDVIHQQHLQNVQPLWGDVEEAEGSQLAPGSIDTVLLVNTLFQLEDKEAAVREVARVLRSGGKLFLIDWSESFGGLGPAADAVVLASTAQDICENGGLIFERSFDAGDHHYGLAFRKP